MWIPGQPVGRPVQVFLGLLDGETDFSSITKSPSTLVVVIRSRPLPGLLPSHRFANTRCVLKQRWLF